MKTLILWLFFATTAFSQHGEMHRLMQKFDVTIDSTATITNPSAVRCERWYTHKVINKMDTTMIVSINENGSLYVKSRIKIPRKKGFLFHITVQVVVSSKHGGHTYVLSKYGSAHPYNTRTIEKDFLMESIFYAHAIDHAWLHAIAMEDASSVAFVFSSYGKQKAIKMLTPQEIKAFKETYRFFELTKIKKT